jgi:hypothetical protein
MDVTAADCRKDLFMSRARVCICLAVRPRASVKTASGLPVQLCAGEDIKLGEFVSAGGHNLKEWRLAAAEPSRSRFLCSSSFLIDSLLDGFALVIRASRAHASYLAALPPSRRFPQAVAPDISAAYRTQRF